MRTARRTAQLRHCRTVMQEFSGLERAPDLRPPRVPPSRSAVCEVFQDWRSWSRCPRPRQQHRHGSFVRECRSNCGVPMQPHCELRIVSGAHMRGSRAWRTWSRCPRPLPPQSHGCIAEYYPQEAPRPWRLERACLPPLPRLATLSDYVQGVFEAWRAGRCPTCAFPRHADQAHCRDMRQLRRVQLQRPARLSSRYYAHIRRVRALEELNRCPRPLPTHTV